MKTDAVFKKLIERGIYAFNSGRWDYMCYRLKDAAEQGVITEFEAWNARREISIYIAELTEGTEYDAATMWNAMEVRKNGKPADCASRMILEDRVLELYKNWDERERYSIPIYKKPLLHLIACLNALESSM